MSKDFEKMRLTYGLSRVTFCKAFGVTPQTIYSWERGLSKPSRYDVVVLDKLWTLCHDSEERLRIKKVLLEVEEKPVQEGLVLFLDAIFSKRGN